MSSHRPSLQILRKRSEFLAVTASGKKWVAPGFILQIGTPHIATDRVRFGLTASKRVGNAVTRNRARRRLRALANEILVQANPQHDYVLVARPSIAKAVYDELRQDLLKGMTRMQLFKTQDKAHT